MAAFRHAFDLEVNAIEFDIHLTTDNQLVINHDYHLNPNLTRTNDGKWIGKIEKPLHQFSSQELNEFKLGKLKPYTFYSLLRPFAQNASDENMPYLTDVFNLAKIYSHTKLLIEVKTTPIQPEYSSDVDKICKATVDTIHQSGIKERCTILAFEVAVVKKIRILDPSLTIFLNQMHMKQSNSAWYSGYDLKDYDDSVPDFVKEIGASGWSSHYRQLNSSNISRAHELELEVYAWTVNSTHCMRTLHQWGIDGIITDRPDKLLKLKL